MTPLTKQCTRCKEVLPRDSFPTRICNGKRYPRTYCRPCFNRSIDAIDTPARRDMRARIERKRQAKNRDAIEAFVPEAVAKRILQDSRRNDRKKNRENDLELDFICNSIRLPCSYCGIEPHNTRMTLDRIDNDLGHLQSNVVTSCSLCNMVRGSMPYEAWLLLCEGMRTARSRGLFDSWYGGPSKHKRGR